MNFADNVATQVLRPSYDSTDRLLSFQAQSSFIITVPTKVDSTSIYHTLAHSLSAVPVFSIVFSAISSAVYPSAVACLFSALWAIFHDIFYSIGEPPQSSFATVVITWIFLIRRATCYTLCFITI